MSAKENTAGGDGTAEPSMEIQAEVPKEESELQKALNKVSDKVMGMNKRLNAAEGQILELKAFENYDKHPYFRYIKESIVNFNQKIAGIDQLFHLANPENMDTSTVIEKI